MTLTREVSAARIVRFIKGVYKRQKRHREMGDEEKRESESGKKRYRTHDKIIIDLSDISDATVSALPVTRCCDMVEKIYQTVVESGAQRAPSLATLKAYHGCIRAVYKHHTGKKHIDCSYLSWLKDHDAVMCTLRRVYLNTKTLASRMSQISSWVKFKIVQFL